MVECPLLAQSGHWPPSPNVRFWGKRTLVGAAEWVVAYDPKRTFYLCAVVVQPVAMNVAGNKRSPGRQGDGSDRVEELGTVTPPLCENTPGRRSDWFLRVLRGYRGGDHTWERLC